MLAVLPNVPGFINAATGANKVEGFVPSFFDELYTYAWFVGLFIAAGLYTLLSWSQRDSSAVLGGGGIEESGVLPTGETEGAVVGEPGSESAAELSE